MDWGRRKKMSASSPMPGRGMSSIAKMFPLSWISRLRQGDGKENGRLGTRIGGRKVKRNVGLHEEKSCRAEKFYGEAEENFWRLSFSDEGVLGKKSGGGCPDPESLSYDWLDETELSPATCRSCRAKGASKVVKKESMDFNDMLLDMRKATESRPRVEAKRETNGQITREPTKSKVSTRYGKLRNLDLHQPSHSPIRDRDMKCARLKGTDKKLVGRNRAECDPNFKNLAVKDITEVESVKPRQASIRISRRLPSSLSSHNHHHHHEASTHSKLQGSECENLGEVNLAEMSLGAGDERKWIYISKDSLKRRSKSGRSSKIKVYSPRTPSKAELCKIRALEDLKKTRMKMRVKEEQEKTVLESLAVVKRSFDPQRDFRNSMLEMILDKGISQPEELEELLACYLILNSDEYHDLIIKVFRQVWFDLNKDRLDPPP